MSASSQHHRAIPESLLPLTPSMLHILLALAQGPKHGYGLMKEVEARTEGEIRLGPGNLYGSIKKMLENGLIEEVGQVNGSGRRRKIYRMTSAGLRLARLESRRLASLVDWARADGLLESADS